MVNVEQLAANYVKHAKVDYVGLWQIAGRVADEMASAPNTEVADLAIEVVERLMTYGVCPGNYTLDGFSFWSGSKIEQLNRIKSEWSRLEGPPTLAQPICWFAILPELS